MDPNSNPSLALCYVTLGRSAVTFSEAFLGIPSFKDYAYSPCPFPAFAPFFPGPVWGGGEEPRVLSPRRGHDRLSLQ